MFDGLTDNHFVLGDQFFSLVPCLPWPRSLRHKLLILISNSYSNFLISKSPFPKSFQTITQLLTLFPKKLYPTVLAIMSWLWVGCGSFDSDAVMLKEKREQQETCFGHFVWFLTSYICFNLGCYAAYVSCISYLIISFTFFFILNCQTTKDLLNYYLQTYRILGKFQTPFIARSIACSKGELDAARPNWGVCEVM